MEKAAIASVLPQRDGFKRNDKMFNMLKINRFLFIQWGTCNDSTLVCMIPIFIPYPRFVSLRTSTGGEAIHVFLIFNQTNMLKDFENTWIATPLRGSQ